MFADEADQDGSKEFFVSAAVFIPSSSANLLHDRIVQIRDQCGFLDGDDFKFSVTTKPKHVSFEQHTIAKQATMEAASQFGCKVCLYLTPHAIAKGKSKGEMLQFSCNTLLSQFDLFLKTKGRGIAFFDRLDEFNQFSYFKEVFQLGLDFSATRRKLKQILVISPTSNNASHMSSITDIITGSFRWVINEPDKDKVGAILWKTLAPLMWFETGKNGEVIVHDRGFCLRPKNLKVQAYQANASATIARLNKYWSK